jgi:hypothetical protein
MTLGVMNKVAKGEPAMRHGKTFKLAAMNETPHPWQKKRITYEADIRARFPQSVATGSRAGTGAYS